VNTIEIVRVYDNSFVSTLTITIQNNCKKVSVLTTETTYSKHILAFKKINFLWGKGANFALPPACDARQTARGRVSDAAAAAGDADGVPPRPPASCPPRAGGPAGSSGAPAGGRADQETCKHGVHQQKVLGRWVAKLVARPIATAAR
jgi:hypothetical protein